MALRSNSWRAWLVPGVPVLILGAALVAVVSRPPIPPDLPRDPGSGWLAVDFSRLAAGGTIPEWDIRRGSWELVESDGRTAMEMKPEPMVEGKVIWSRVLAEGGGIRARMYGERTRRAWPRYCVGMHGRVEYQFRAVAATGRLEIVAGNDVIASAPWPDGWRDNTPVWLELLVRPVGTVYRLEGRTWTEDGARPDTPSLAHDLPEPPGFLYAVLQGAPLALRPIRTDRLEVLPGPVP